MSFKPEMQQDSDSEESVLLNKMCMYIVHYTVFVFIKVKVKETSTMCVHFPI